MAARFETLDGQPNGDGLDSTERVPWLLLRVNTPKQVRLRDASNWVVGAPRQGLVNVVADGLPTLADRTITVTAVGEGTTTIEARSPDGRHAIHLTAYTRPLLLVTIAFYFVRDSAEPRHGTTRPMADAARALHRINEIYTPQANLTFQQVDLQPVTVPGDLGRHIDLPRSGGGGTEMASIEAATVPSQVMGVRALGLATRARVRVHFVWSLRTVGDRRGDKEGAGRIGGQTLLIEDRLGADMGTIVAHEVGHTLGLDHPGARRGWLMFPTTQGIGTFIPKRHVEILHSAS